MAQRSRPKTQVAASSQAATASGSSSKRNSGLFSFLKWFRSPSRESVSSLSLSPSLDSVAADSTCSLNSAGTASSFCFVPPAVYGVNDKRININQPETDTYRARLSQLDRIRERDKNITLRKKYNLFFNRDKEVRDHEAPENCKSLPLIKKSEEGHSHHRRTNSDSSNNVKRAQSTHSHVKGKRRAPSAPPMRTTMNNNKDKEDNVAKRKKRLAPQPPVKTTVVDVEAMPSSSQVKTPILSNKTDKVQTKFWQKSSKYEPVEPPIEVAPLKNTKEEPKISPKMLFLTNISELDREASKIIQNSKNNNGELKMLEPETEIPEPRKKKNIMSKLNVVSNVRRMSKVPSYFSRKNSGELRPETIEEVETVGALLKSETTACTSKFAVTQVPKKLSTSNWICPICRAENVHWRIICTSCSTIKPYGESIPLDNLKSSEDKLDPTRRKEINLPTLMRSQTQIEIPLKKTQRPEEKEKLKQMLIEMKNSLPKKPKDQASKVRKNSTSGGSEIEVTDKVEKTNEKLPKAAEENVINVINEPTTSKNAFNDAGAKQEVNLSNSSTEKDGKYRLMRSNEFEDIYTTKIAGISQHVYANLQESVKEKSPGRKDVEAGNSNALVNKDTLEVNKLIKKLENAIVKGNATQAATYATELAQLRINCSVACRKITKDPNEPTIKYFSVDIYVEDRVSHRGPFPVQVSNKQTLMELKEQVDKEFNIPVDVQRWILGKELANNNDATLEDYKVVEGSPIFLYLVASTASTAQAPKEEKSDKKTINESTDKILNGPSTTSGENIKLKEITTNNDKEINTEKKSPNEKQSNNAPQVVAEHLKVHVMIKPKINSEAQISINKTSNNDLQIKSTPVTTTVLGKSSLLVTPSITRVKTDMVQPEEVKILSPKVHRRLETKNTERKPPTWICHMCTFLNESPRNICAVCASVKQAKPEIEAVVENDRKQPQTNDKEKQLHYELMHLDRTDLVPNSETFQCQICFLQVPPNIGVTLRDCLHQFCKECLSNTIEFCEDAQVKCPYIDKDYSCDVTLQDREIKALVSKKIYEQYLAKSIAQAENKMNSFHCKTPDCRGWCVYEDNVNEFRCPLCKKTNCINCQAIHTGLNCRQHQQRIQSETDEDAQQTHEMLKDMVEKGEALVCPACNVFLMKKWGCDWVRCSMCKTEICWVTKGFRWGPTGKGDVSGGCKCGVNGVKCHPKCNYCH